MAKLGPNQHVSKVWAKKLHKAVKVLNKIAKREG